MPTRPCSPPRARRAPRRCPARTARPPRRPATRRRPTARSRCPPAPRVVAVLDEQHRVAQRRDRAGDPQPLRRGVRPAVHDDDPRRRGAGDEPRRRRTERGVVHDVLEVQPEPDARVAREVPPVEGGRLARRQLRRQHLVGDRPGARVGSRTRPDRSSARSRPRSVAMAVSPWSVHPDGTPEYDTWSPSTAVIVIGKPASGCGMRDPSPISPLKYHSAPPSDDDEHGGDGCRARPTASGGGPGAHAVRCGSDLRGDSGAVASVHAGRLRCHVRCCCLGSHEPLSARSARFARCAHDPGGRRRSDRMAAMRITVLAGGIGGARFLRGLLHHLERVRPTPRSPSSATPATTSGCTACGLPRPRHGHVHPRRRHQRGARLGPRGRDLHRQGRARGLRRRADVVRPRRPGHRHPPRPHADARAPATRSPRSPRPCATAGSPACALLPMSDDRAETHVVVDDPRGDRPDGTPLRTAIHFQEWWIRLPRRRCPRTASSLVGVDDAKPGPDVLDAIASADVVLLPPSATRSSRSARSCRCPASRDALRATAAPVVGRLPHRRRRAGARHGRRLPHRHRRRDVGERGRRATTAPRVGRRPPRRLARRRRADAARVDELDAARHRVRARCPLMMTDVDATARDRRRGLDLAADAVRR